MATIAFIGGGNMAGAIVGGLVAGGQAADSILVVDPGEAQRQGLASRFGVRVLAAADASLGARRRWSSGRSSRSSFAPPPRPCAPYVGGALQLSVMAGIRSDAIVEASGSERVVRAMPNTPALIGQGVAGVYARPAVSAADRERVAAALAPTGQIVWLADEAALDAVTALSGSGPAYVFHLIEAMLAAGREMGLGEDEARRLAVQTVAGAAALAAASSDSPETLRRNVTSPGGTTHAAMTLIEARGVKAALVEAILAARDRARELGDEFGRPPS